MKALEIITLGFLAVLIGCSEFPNKYENVIELEKVRPFAIVLDPPEAAPGDTVRVMLHFHGAGRQDLSIDWQIALDYTVDNYGGAGIEGEIRDLDLMMLPGGDSVSFSFVVPTGADNPILLNRMVPEEIDGIGSKRELLGTLDAYISAHPDSGIPPSYAPYADQMLAITVLRAKIRTDIDLDITKRLTVRYSNKVRNAAFNNTNENPHLDSIAIIRVNKKDLADPDSIRFYQADTQYFRRNAFNDSIPVNNLVDTFVVGAAHSYFLLADTLGAAQIYRSAPTSEYPLGQEHSEEMFYQWFYTNMDASGAAWEDLIEIGGDKVVNSIHAIRLKIPENRAMHNFHIRVVVRDYRPEFGVLAAQGVGFLEARGYFKFE